MTPPIIMCPDDVIIEAATNEDGRNVTWNMPTVVDNTGEESAIMVIPAIKSPWRIRIGSVTLRYVATDSAGNKAQCNFEITVVGKFVCLFVCSFVLIFFFQIWTELGAFQGHKRHIFFWGGKVIFPDFFPSVKCFFPVENCHFGRPKTNFSDFEKWKEKKKAPLLFL